MRAFKAICHSAVAIMALAALVACSSSDDSGSNGTSAEESALIADSQEAVEAAQEGLLRKPPAEGPAAQTGKNVWAIACTAAAPGCQFPVESVADAGEELGWDVTLIDGKGDPNVFNSSIRQAVAAQADGIVVMAIDCPLVKNSLEYAKQQGVPVVGIYSFDCDDPEAGGGTALFSQGPNFYGQTTADFFTAQGVLKAQQTIAATEANAKVVYVSVDNYLSARYIEKGLTEKLAECEDCEIVETLYGTTAELANGVTAQKIETAFQKHPDANVLAYYADSRLLATVQTVRKLTERNPDLVVIGADGAPGVEPLLAEGLVTGSQAIPFEWLGWAGADALNRVFAGETEIPDQGLGFQVIDKDHGLTPDGKSWTPSVDFKAAYREVWK